MSLIEEALRRAQEPILNPPPDKPQAAAPAPPSSQPQVVSPAHSWSLPPQASARSSRPASPLGNPVLTVAVAVLGLIVVLLAGGAFWLGHPLTANFRHPRPPVGPLAARALSSSAAQQTPSSEEPAQPSKAGAAPSRPTTLDQPFVLTGVVEGGGEPYAIINGVIVAVGERVGGATLLEIANGSVRLRLANGQERVLRAAR